MDIEQVKKQFVDQTYFLRVSEVAEDEEGTIWVMCEIMDGPLAGCVISIPYSEVMEDKPCDGPLIPTSKMEN